MEDSYTFDGSIISFSTLSSRATSPTRHPINSRVPSTRSLQDSGILRPKPTSITSPSEPPLTRESSPELVASLESETEAPPLPSKDKENSDCTALATLRSGALDNTATSISTTTPELPQSLPDSPPLDAPHYQQEEIELPSSDLGIRVERIRVNTADSANDSAYAYSSGSGDSGSSPEDNDDDLERASHNLLMPSMRISDDVRAADHPYRRNLSVQTDLSRLDADPRRSTRLLILGKTCEQRKALARLLNDSIVSGAGAGDDASSFADDTDMSASFCSVPADSQKVSPRSPDPSHDIDGMFTYLSNRTTYARLAHPSSDELCTNDLVRRLTAPLEHLESMINPSYPPCVGLLRLIQAGSVGEFDAAVLIMSSPPTSTEVALARGVSQVLPIVPVLILPPCPSARPQKTAALVQAVTQQLTTARVCWSPTTSDRSGRQTSSIYLLPHDVFAYPFVEPKTLLDSGPVTSPALSSLASSQELIPPSPGRIFNSRSSSSSSLRSANSGSSSSRGRSHARNTSAGSTQSTSNHDLRRLRLLVGTAFGVEQLGHNRALSFLDWRDIELAAQGQVIDFETAADEIAQLPAEWHEKPIERAMNKSGPSMLDFSKRVAERRSALAQRRIQGRAGPRTGRPSFHKRRSTSSDEQRADGESEAGGYFQTRRQQYQHHQGHSSMLTELVATPRPPLPHLPCSSNSAGRSQLSTASSMYLASDSVPPLQDMSSASMSSASWSSSGNGSSVGVGSILLQAADPFHLPSLLHLVGLNIRLALFPKPSGDFSPLVEGIRSQEAVEDEEEKGAPVSKKRRHAAQGSRSRWIGTVALCGFVFLAGVACGIVASEGAGGQGGINSGAGSGGSAALRLLRGGLRS